MNTESGKLDIFSQLWVCRLKPEYNPIKGVPPCPLSNRATIHPQPGNMQSFLLMFLEPAEWLFNEAHWGCRKTRELGRFRAGGLCGPGGSSSLCLFSSLHAVPSPPLPTRAQDFCINYLASTTCLRSSIKAEWSCLAIAPGHGWYGCLPLVLEWKASQNGLKNKP